MNPPDSSPASPPVRPRAPTPDGSLRERLLVRIEGGRHYPRWVLFAALASLAW